MSDERPQINASKIAFGAGVAGAIFTIGSMLIFLTGVPLLWFLFPAAIVVGCAIALVLRFVRRETPGTGSILSVGAPAQEPSPQDNDECAETGADFSGFAPRVRGAF